MAVKISPIFNDAQLDASGNPWSGAKLFTYAAGSSTKTTTYQDSAGATPHANPIVLNSRGEPPAPIWLTSGVTYKFVLTSPTDSDPPVSATRTVDNVSGTNDTTVTLDQWVAGPAPTFIGTTSFSLVGDQTTTFHVGRRLKTTNSGGTIYSTITVSAYTTLTTLTVVNDSGVLDSGLSAVSYGLISTVGTSDPVLAVINAAGDMIYGTAADTPARLAIGTAGGILKVNAGATAPEYLALGTARQVLQVNAGATAPAWSAPITLATEQASTSGTSIDFTGIPAGIQRITVMFYGVSTNGTSQLLIQIGDAGGIETTGYLGASSAIDTGVTTANSTAGFIINGTGAAAVRDGTMTLTLEDSANFAWVAAGVFARSDAAQTTVCSGSKSTSAVLDRVRITTVNGTDAFDLGAINVSYE